MWDNYFEFMDNEFIQLRFNESEGILFNNINLILVNKTRIRYFKTFPKNLFHPSNRKGNITKYFGSKYSGIQTYALLSPSICSNPIYVQQLIDIGLIPNAENALIEVHHRLSRILFQPQKEILNEAKEFIKENHLDHCVGVQYRTGGSTATAYERTVFLTMDIVIESAKIIDTAFSKKNRTVFLTTDSTKVLHKVPKIMQSLEVKSVTKYNINHSASSRKSMKAISDIMHRILSDLYIFSSCDSIFWTHGSSFGELGYWLSNSHEAYKICK